MILRLMSFFFCFSSKLILEVDHGDGRGWLLLGYGYGVPRCFFWFDFFLSWLSCCGWPRSKHTQTSENGASSIELSEHPQKKEDGYVFTLVCCQELDHKDCFRYHVCCVKHSEHTQKMKDCFVCTLVCFQKCDHEICFGNQACCEHHCHNKLNLFQKSGGPLCNESMEQAKQMVGNIPKIDEFIKYEGKKQPTQVYSINLDFEDKDNDMEEIHQGRKVVESRPTLSTCSGGPRTINPGRMSAALDAWEARLQKKQAEREVQQRKEEEEERRLRILWKKELEAKTKAYREHCTGMSQ